MAERKAIEGLICTCNKVKIHNTFHNMWLNDFEDEMERLTARERQHKIGDLIPIDCKCKVYDIQDYKGLVELMDLDFNFISINPKHNLTGALVGGGHWIGDIRSRNK